MQKIGAYRFYFLFREESRVHIHVSCADGEAKFWLELGIELATNHKLLRVQLKQVEKLIEEHYEDFRKAWSHYFPDRG